MRPYPGERAVLDATGLAVPAADTALFLIQNQSYLTVRGFDLRNYKTTNPELVPAGILVSGASHHIELRNNNIHGIWNSHRDGNAFGIAIFGTSATQSLGAVVIDGNKVHDLQTGNSESLVLNGNVSGFEVTGNDVYGNNNIGIDFIGFEGVCREPALDQARDGICRGNKVYRNSSRSNPSYYGESSAGGIYCDGAARILIEGNLVYLNDIGVELACEHSGKATRSILLRDNVIRANRVTGISLGGYDSRRGATQECVISNNTLFENDSLGSGTGEINLQFYVVKNRILQNIFCAGAQGLIIGNQAAGSSGNVIDYNLYFSPLGASKSQWEWNSRTYSGFASWKRSRAQDAHSVFATPGFVDSALNNLKLKAGSAAQNAGDPLFVPPVEERDFLGGARVLGGRVDIGAYEF
jgi:Right handed beta helix region